MSRPMVPLGELAEKIAMGPFGSSIKVETFVSDGIPVISGAHLRGIRVEDGEFNFVTPEHAQRLRNANVFRGDVIFTHAGNIGQVAYIPEKSKYDRYVISQRQFYLRCKVEKVLPAFVAYYFKTHEGRHSLLANASQVGVPSIARPATYLRTVPIPLPTVPEQQKVVQILESLDDKIELNRRMNETMEAMARAIFKSWFVDFDPVRAKASGEPPESICRRLGLTPDILALFPDDFQDSELGEIPRGWTPAAMASIATKIFSGGTPDTRKPEYWNGLLPWFSSGETRNRFVVRTEKAISEKAVEESSTKLAEPGDILIASAGQGNTRGQTSYCAIRTYINQSVVSVRTNAKIVHPLWLYYNLSDRYDEMRAISDSHSIRGSLTTKLVGSMLAILPDFRLSQAFGRLVTPLVERQISNLMESVSIADGRDGLLPRLLSGECAFEKEGSD